MWQKEEAAQDTRGPARPFFQPPLHHLPHNRPGAGRTASPQGAELGEQVPAGVLHRIDNMYAKTLRLILLHFLEYERKGEAGSGDEPRAFVENYCVMLIALFKNLALRAGLGVSARGQLGTQEGLGHGDRPSKQPEGGRRGSLLTCVLSQSSPSFCLR